jgi:hypothetical protein
MSKNKAEKPYSGQPIISTRETSVLKKLVFCRPYNNATTAYKKHRSLRSEEIGKGTHVAMPLCHGLRAVSDKLRLGQKATMAKNRRTCPQQGIVAVARSRSMAFPLAQFLNETVIRRKRLTRTFGSAG